MARRSLRTRRSHMEWGVRGALALAAAGMGYVSVSHTLAFAIRGSNVERAHALAPGDGRIAAILSEKRIATDTGIPARTESIRLARDALRTEPLAVAGVATLGMNAQLAGDDARAHRLFGYSQRLSRRDLRTQLWGIEDAAARGDIPRALRHYDIALRTSKTAPDLLFPVLSGAIGDPAIRAALLRTFAGGAPWASGFIDYMAVNAADPRLAATLLPEAARVGVSVSRDAHVSLVASLLARGYPVQAWRHYASTHRGADPRRSRDPDFAAADGLPTPFDWTTPDEPGLSTTLQQGGLDFAASPGVGGTAVRQMQLLPPGEYALVGTSSDIDLPGDARPYWRLTCVDGRELGRVSVTAAPQGRFAGPVRVPAGCPVQMLSLEIRASDAVGGATGRIDRVTIRPR